MPESAARPTTLTTVREHLEHVERGDIEQATMDYAEDAVFENRQGGATEGSVVAGTHHGRAAIGQWLANWFLTFGSYRFEIEESIENGDRVYLALCSIARGGISDAEVTMPTHHAFTVRDSLIARHVFSGEPEEIRREAGIAV